MTPLVDGYGDPAVQMSQMAMELFVVKKNKNNKLTGKVDCAM
jgi:hypothetical protein